MKLPTRRNASLLLSAIILALLAVLLLLTNACLLPARTIRATEISYSTGETQVIRRETAGLSPIICPETTMLCCSPPAGFPFRRSPGITWGTASWI